MLTFMKTLWITLYTVQLVLSQDTNDCTPAQTCFECMAKISSAGVPCGWCEDLGFTSSDKNRPRCNYESNLQGKCTNVTNPRNQKFIPVIYKQNFNSTIQVYPQGINLTLRPGQAETFRIKVSPAKDYPVDLYYLMDLSYSMNDDLQNLKGLGGQIANAIRGITRNFRLGFGSFVDKTVSPYVQVERATPCSSCRATFGFQHNQNFTANEKLFENKVKEQTISGNLDIPEGGFDALMQVAVCQQKIGWRPADRARRIVVFVTDASFHMAGDGKLGGIVTPNDGKCHLDSKDIYTKSNNLDYPSVSHLKKVLKGHKIVPIMAVTADVNTVYQNLAEEWKDLGAVSGVLAADSGNVVELIRDNYKKIAQRVRLTEQGKHADIKIEYKTVDCKQGSGNECDGVKPGTEVSFDVTVTAMSCSDSLKKSKGFKIDTAGFGEIQVNTDVICSCDCEDPSRAIANHPDCDGQGKLACGKCYCNAGRYGDDCKCESATQADDSLCRKNRNDTNEAVCNGFGNCLCGKCACFKRSNKEEKITGTHCECKNFGCERHSGKVCGGADHGRCECNVCRCEGVWTGSNCGTKNCALVEHQCVKNGKKCNDQGKCECGKCNCDKGWKGDHCESCPACPGRCSANRDCVLCQVFQKGDQKVCNNCSLNIKITNGTMPSDTSRCTFDDGEGCFIQFNYGEDQNKNFTIWARPSKECPRKIVSKPNILAIVLGIIGGIVLAGLIALILWKLLVSAYDNYEYHRFEKERSKSKWQKAENPIYKPSKQKYENPVYAGNR